MTAKDPADCPNCRRLQARVDSLEADLAALKEVVAQLGRQLAAARKDSSTSSKPPSSQGQRTLGYQCVNDFHQELVAPAAAPAFHDEAHPPVGVLLEDREGEAVQPGDVRPQHALPDSRVVLAERHVEGPMARVLDVPAIMPSKSAVGWPGST